MRLPQGQSFARIRGIVGAWGPGLGAWWPWRLRCLACRGPGPYLVCPPCWGPWLTRAPRGQVAGAPAWPGVALAWQAHQGLPRALVHRLKLQGQAQAAAHLAEGMAPLLPVGGDWCLVPVPSTWWRRARRGHWPAGRLAQALAHRSGLPWLPRALRRVGGWGSQVGRSRGGRLGLDAGRFRSGAQAAALRGRRVLLVDDVLATGATARAAAQALLQAGAVEVALVVATQAGGWPLGLAGAQPKDR